MHLKAFVYLIGTFAVQNDCHIEVGKAVVSFGAFPKHLLWFDGPHLLLL